MLTASIRRKTLALLLLAMTFAASWASASGPRLIASPPSAQSVESAGWELFNRVLGFLRRGASKADCEINPNGRCVTKNPPSQSKTGCNIDPWGRCLP